MPPWSEPPPLPRRSRTMTPGFFFAPSPSAIFTCAGVSTEKERISMTSADLPCTLPPDCLTEMSFTGARSRSTLRTAGASPPAEKVRSWTVSTTRVSGAPRIRDAMSSAVRGALRGCWFTLTITSPALRPAFSAGEASMTRVTRTPPSVSGRGASSTPTPATPPRAALSMDSNCAGVRKRVNLSPRGCSMERIASWASSGDLYLADTRCCRRANQSAPLKLRST
mmetsp:Transcript_12703/g.34018  ORF Transcript_12703/g.34018 Transcript_12703/m.34018 type:complete len:224 (+) Transcript_12703:416-1087(+)